ncbi:MAG: serine/threonine protein kinase, partial [Myxococcales bacterium]|nr:serine/threonine protein kinase [Myxococcales bacterium]
MAQRTLVATDSPDVYGKYQLLERLSKGDVGEVFRAKSRGVEGFEKVLVVKRIHPHLSRNETFLGAFVEEAKVAVTLSHANVVQVFDLGLVDDTYFIAMEHVAGQDLERLQKRARLANRPLPRELAVYVASEVAKALDYAHRRRDNRFRPLGIVHGRVEASNILVSFEGEVKLGDFGTERARATLFRDGANDSEGLAHLPFSAPEQVRGGAMDARTDLYGLGVVLYGLLANRNPFLGTSREELTREILAGNAPMVHSLDGSVPEELSQIVAKAMHLDPDQRYGSASEFYEALLRFLYSSGRRVGAYELSKFMEDLDDDGDRTATLGAFAGGVEAIQHTGTHMDPTAHRKTAVEGPDQEVALLFLLAPSNRAAPESSVRSLVARFGGRVFERSHEGHRSTMLIGFGLETTDGRAVDAALRCALRVSRLPSLAADGSAVASVQLAVGLASVPIDADGMPVGENLFANLQHYFWFGGQLGRF